MPDETTHDALGGKVTAPWSADQVESLNAYQRSGAHHPFTCGRDHDGEAVLAAQKSGWICPADDRRGSPCGYLQDWAHGFMADWSWKQAADDIAAIFSAVLPQALLGDDPESRLIAAVDRLKRAAAAEDHADADAEHAYAGELVALAARDLVRAVERGQHDRPAGWDDSPVHGTPDDPSWPAHRDFTCGACAETFGSNFSPGEVECVECEARLCSSCGHWDARADS